MSPETARIAASLALLEQAGVLAAEPRRVRSFLVECVSLVQEHLPPELLAVLRGLQGEALAPAELGEARLACWKHVEACACYGSGVEVGAVRALLTALEQVDAVDAARLGEVARLVEVCKPPSGAVRRILLRLFPEAEASLPLEGHATAS